MRSKIWAWQPVLIVLALVGGAAAASCEDTGPSPVGEHPDDAGLATAQSPAPPGDAASNGHADSAAEDAGDAGEDATDASDASDAGDASDAADAPADG